MLKDLTSREREIFNLLIEGVSPKEIAHRLNISNSTVDFHRTRLYKKLDVHSIHELFAKYSTNGKAPYEPEAAIPVPAGLIIPANNLGFYSESDIEAGGNSISEVYAAQEIIDGTLMKSVLSLKINLARRESKGYVYAKALTHGHGLIQRLRQANGIRFKARGDGKSWFLELHTAETIPESNFASYRYLFGTIRDQVIVVDIPYSSLFLPEWLKQYSFDFNKETIKMLAIEANSATQGYGPSFLQIFDFEAY